MKRADPYYDVEVTVRCGDRERPWPELPHIYLANMEISGDAIVAFSNIYGNFFGNLSVRRDAPKTVRAAMDIPGNPVSLDMVARAQEVLRVAWRGEHDAAEMIAGRSGHSGIIFGPLHPKVVLTADTIELVAEDAWTFCRFAFLRDRSLGKAQVCVNPACEAPYFLRGKEGNVFCGHRCAVIVNNHKRAEEAMHSAKKSRKRATR